MPELNLIIGRAGSGKTHTLIERVCVSAAGSALCSPQHPPLLVIVPEQQALMTEQALLERLGAMLGRPAATSRIRVMSLSRLGNWLIAQAGQQRRRDGDMGRRLLIWRILSEMEGPAGRQGRQARAEQLSEVLAELRQFGTDAQQLRERAAFLATQPAASRSEEELPARLEELADLLERYLGACDELGLSFSASVANVTRLLSSRLWPLLEHTEVFIDGFAGFTPPEEEAILAILSRTRRVSAAVLLDPQRIRAALPQDSADWFAPGRELYESLQALAQRCGISPKLEALDAAPRWQQQSGLATLAVQGAMPATEPPQDLPLSFTVCNDERTEVLEAVRLVRRLIRDEGHRPAEISVIARDLAPYAELLEMRLAEHGIPAFIDRRSPLSWHPLLQLMRGLLRMAAGLAGRDELGALLRCGLLPFSDEGTVQRDAVDRLLKYAASHGLPAARWLDERDWNWHRDLAAEEGRLHSKHDPQQIREQLRQFDGWRRELMQPVRQLREYLAGSAVELAGLAALLRDCLPPAGSAGLENDEDVLVHSRVLELLEEMELQGAGLAIGSDTGLEAGELVNWLEYGFGRLQQAMPPLRQDHLLVTEVDRGRHHPVRTSILLGMADGSWPATAVASPWFSDSQRELINGEGRLLSAGSREDCQREAWLAMIALTRASRQLILLRPGADSEGRKRPASAWYQSLLDWSQATERMLSQEQSAQISEVESEADLVQAVALCGQSALDLPGLTTQTRRALDWAQRWRSLRRTTQQLDPQFVNAQAGKAALSCSATRLENFAACPYRHYVRYWLRLDEDREPAFDGLTLGNMYHSVFERTVQRLNAEGYDWLGADWQRISACSRSELEQLRTELLRETARERVDYVLERAGILLEQHSRRLAAWLADNAGRKPLQTELRFGGSGAQLPPYELQTDAGMIRISGFIDRLDANDAGEATVIDYKLGSRRQAWNRLLAGYQLQLFVYMLAIRGHSVAGSIPLEPVEAEYQPVEVQWNADGEADFSASQALRPAGHKKNDKPETRQRLHDWALAETQRVLAELGGRLLSGEVRAWPLSDGRSWTACNGCPARSVCRFDPVAGDSYREMLPLGNSDIQKLLLQGEPDFSGSAMRSILSPQEDGNG